MPAMPSAFLLLVLVAEVCDGVAADFRSRFRASTAIVKIIIVLWMGGCLSQSIPVCRHATVAGSINISRNRGILIIGASLFVFLFFGVGYRSVRRPVVIPVHVIIVFINVVQAAVVRRHIVLGNHVIIAVIFVEIFFRVVPATFLFRICIIRAVSQVP